MFIPRDFTRTEQDDFKINVEHHIRESKECVDVYTPGGTVVGWKIQNQYE